MKHPPYHLRLNKAVDRFMLIEALRYLERMGGLSEYTYYGFGGPYLEDFRLLYESYPKINRMVSIEENRETFKRQEFHRPCGSVELRKMNFQSFLAQYESKDEKSIFWLDYTRLEYRAFDDFMSLLSKVAANSVLKVTLPAETRPHIDKPEDFRAEFGKVMPDQSADPPIDFMDFACMLQKMLQVAAQRALPSAMSHMFQPISSFCYSDGTRMFTLTGIVCLRSEKAELKGLFKGWRFANLNWKPPKLIDVPFLSTKERLHLQKHLPCRRDAGRKLIRALGYLIDADKKKTAGKMRQYANFHRYFPYFVKAIP